LNEEKQIKNILDKAKIFKSRAIRSPEDMKRHDRILLDEGKAMRVAYEQLGWSFDKISTVFDRDPRAVEKKVSKPSEGKVERKVRDEKESVGSNPKPEPSVTEENKNKSSLSKDAEHIADTMQTNDTAPQVDVSKKVVPPSTEEKLLTCSGSPDGIDVNVLKSWGVPLRKRAEIISQWRSWHKRGMHDICQAFIRLQQDLEVRKFSYKEAEVLLNADVWALESQDEECHEAIDYFRIYRPREHIKSYQVFIKELEEMHKAHYKVSPRHLNDIENLLNQLRKAVLISRDTKEYEGLLKMEENPLFEILESHCFTVYDYFWALKNDLENIRSLDLRTIQGGSNQTQGKPTKKERIILQKKLDNSTKELQRAIDYALRVKIYSISECHLCIRDTKPETNS
jgi:hypothetical protein